MYLSKNAVRNLFLQMNYLYSEKNFQKQGRIQFVSIMKYFFAMDEFIKQAKHSCDTRNREDKEIFISNVAKVVRLSDPQENISCDTKDLFSVFGNDKKLDVGSNFFSANAISASLKSEKKILFPTRFPALLECNKGIISIVDDAYERFANDKDYLFGNINNFALLFLWLNRNTHFLNEKTAYTDFLNHLKNTYSPQIVASLKWESTEVKQKIDEFLFLFDFSDTSAFLNPNDLIFDELNEMQVKNAFSIYLVIHCEAQRPDFKPHCVNVCESWLDEHLENNGIGNLFRYKDPAVFKTEYERIKKIDGFKSVNERDQSGRPITALNHYQNFLNSVSHSVSPLQQRLENFAQKNNLLISVDTYGDRVIIQNACIIAVDEDNHLFTCIYNDKLDLFREKIKSAITTNDIWHLCRVDQDFPKNPYNNNKEIEFLSSDNDICLYTQIVDISHFETRINELIGIVSENRRKSIPELFSPVQIIYYGVPGSGKSHQIEEDLKAKGITEENHQQKRVVFHPDYCNADFVGQILPVTKRDGGIRYQFKAGPFTKILRDAYENPTKEYALIIEEINRGNAAAIFGDLFQLLDRKKENDPIETVNGNLYGPGWSDYCIENDYINAYFRGAYDSEEVPNPLPPKTLGGIIFNDNVDIRLPPNLSIYATMNTSDQNVFTLDNAFQRRWEMKQISNDLAHDDPTADTTKQYNQIIGNTNVKWGEFREAINEIIMQSAEENGLSSMEDKRLGGWFITPKKDPNAAEGETPKITNEAFAEKVLKYLWDDAFKFDRPKHFGEIKTLEDLTKKFKTDGFKIFKDESISKLSQQNGTSAAQTGTPEA